MAYGITLVLTFILMQRPPPRSTLFPYHDALPIFGFLHRGCRNLHLAGQSAGLPARDAAPGGRSEEHTSELQSHVKLVCRLLLEKKIRASLYMPRLFCLAQLVAQLPNRFADALHER